MSRRNESSFLPSVVYIALFFDARLSRRFKIETLNKKKKGIFPLADNNHKKESKEREMFLSGSWHAK